MAIQKGELGLLPKIALGLVLFSIAIVTAFRMFNTDANKDETNQRLVTIKQVLQEGQRSVIAGQNVGLKDYYTKFKGMYGGVTVDNSGIVITDNGSGVFQLTTGLNNVHTELSNGRGVVNVVSNGNITAVDGDGELASTIVGNTNADTLNAGFDWDKIYVIAPKSKESSFKKLVEDSPANWSLINDNAVIHTAAGDVTGVVLELRGYSD